MFVKTNMNYVSNESLVVKKINRGVMRWLEDSGQLLEDMIKVHTPKDSGETAESWTHEVESDGRISASCTVKSGHPNASFEEFGTGDYATEPHYPGFKGKIPWKYQDDRGEWHTTDGKRPTQPAQRAFEVCSPIIRENGSRYILRG